MARTASEVLETARRSLAPDAGANRLVPLVAAGTAPREVIAALAMEEHHIVTSDRRSLLHLAERAAAQPAVGAYFAGLAHGEDLALDALGGLLAACGVDGEALRAYEPRPGCQAYPAYMAWLALNGEPVDVALAMTANFTAWGGYCAALSRALRDHYGFDDEACAFFDFFAAPAPEVARQAEAAVAEGLAADLVGEDAHRFGRLLQAYELMFWNTLADTAG